MTRLSLINTLRFLGLFVIALGLPVAIFLASQKTSFFKIASGEPANLAIDTAISENIKGANYWNNISQGGSDDTRMLKPVIGQLAKIKPDYIRIDHIYDRYGVVSRNSSGQVDLNWAVLDLAVDDIILSGATPFLSLSYMPQALARGDETSEPKNWAEWEYLVKRTIEHYSGKEELNIPMVYYEVWNEPDLFGQYKIGKGKNYQNLYFYSARGAESASNVQEFKFGGPATTELYSNWFIKLMDFIKLNNLRIDFYSWHNYSGDLSSFEKESEAVNAWLTDYPEYGGVELIISEYGHDSNLNSGYDSNFSAIHTMALVATLDGKVDKIFAFQAKDNKGEEKYSGNWGMLTHEAFGLPVPKPRYRAMEFMNKLVGDKMNIEGQGSWVKSMGRNNEGTIRLLVVNYDSNSKHSESVPITFRNLKANKFIFRRIDFGGKTREYPVEIQSSSWSIRELLDPNTAMIIEIEPQIVQKPLSYNPYSPLIIQRTDFPPRVLME